MLNEQQHSQTLIAREKATLRKIKQDPKFILKIKKPTDDELKLAFELDPYLAMHFGDLSVDVQYFLVEKDLKNIEYIADADKNVQNYVISRDPSLYDLIRSPKLSSFILAHHVIL